MKQQVIISNHLQADLSKAIAACQPDRLFAVADDVTAEHCWPKIREFDALKGAHLITIPASDVHKDLRSVEKIWTSLQEHRATRHSCVINLGGGMVTDLGGFAASTFKRGIRFINIPTTLLAMVDASVGGKTGINYGGLKNEIGVFNDANFVILHAAFLQTLDLENLRSGYAEMLKHGLISNDKMMGELLTFDLSGDVDIHRLQGMIAASVAVKEEVVTRDPFEQNMRKALNLGHTFGHAFESWSLKRKPVLHGYAVAYGLVCELYLSCVKCGFPTEKMRQAVRFVKEWYGQLPFTCDDYDGLIALMRHDKKNLGDEINFTLLADVGDIKLNQTATMEEIKNAFDFLREGE